MARTYDIDPEAARAAGQSNYITQTGKYTGVFEMAVAKTSEKGTDGIEFTFKSREGQQANYLQLWTHNNAGEPLYGYKVLQALMTCIKVRQIAPQRAGKDELFPGLCNKPIGLLLQREPYDKNDGSEGFKFNIFGCFDPMSELTAKEILDRVVQPAQLAQMVAQLADRPKQSKKVGDVRSVAPASAPNFQDMDDDIPF